MVQSHIQEIVFTIILPILSIFVIVINLALITPQKNTTQIDKQQECQILQQAYNETIKNDIRQMEQINLSTLKCINQSQLEQRNENILGSLSTRIQQNKRIIQIQGELNFVYDYQHVQQEQRKRFSDVININIFVYEIQFYSENQIFSKIFHFENIGQKQKQINIEFDESEEEKLKYKEYYQQSIKLNHYMKSDSNILILFEIYSPIEFANIKTKFLELNNQCRITDLIFNYILILFSLGLMIAVLLLCKLKNWNSKLFVFIFFFLNCEPLYLLDIDQNNLRLSIISKLLATLQTAALIYYYTSISELKQRKKFNFIILLLIQIVLAVQQIEATVNQYNDPFSNKQFSGKDYAFIIITLIFLLFIFINNHLEYKAHILQLINQNNYQLIELRQEKRNLLLYLHFKVDILAFYVLQLSQIGYSRCENIIINKTIAFILLTTVLFFFDQYQIKVNYYYFNPFKEQKINKSAQPLENDLENEENKNNQIQRSIEEICVQNEGFQRI